MQPKLGGTRSGLILSVGWELKISVKMMSSMFEVTFRVKVTTKRDERVCVVGNCEQLGDWMAHKALPLSLERCDNNE